MITPQTIFPGQRVTGSVATLICRRIARDGGARLSAWRFSAIGVALVPAQLAVAALGLSASPAGSGDNRRHPQALRLRRRQGA